MIARRWRQGKPHPSFRQAATRHGYYSHLFDGFVHLACVFIAIGPF
jgi:hypothetical protein